MIDSTSRARRFATAGLLAALLLAALLLAAWPLTAQEFRSGLPQEDPVPYAGQDPVPLAGQDPVPFAGQAVNPYAGQPAEPFEGLPSVGPFVPGMYDEQPQVPPPPQPEGEFAPALSGQITIEPYFPDPNGPAGATILPFPPEGEEARRQAAAAPAASGGIGFEWVRLDPRGDSAAFDPLRTQNGFRLWFDMHAGLADTPVSHGLQCRLFYLKTPSGALPEEPSADDDEDEDIDLFDDDTEEDDVDFLDWVNFIEWWFDDDDDSAPPAETPRRDRPPVDGLTMVWFDIEAGRTRRHQGSAISFVSAGLRTGAWSRRTLPTTVVPGSRYDFLGIGPIVSYEGRYVCSRTLSFYGIGRGAILMGSGKHSGYPAGSVVESGFDPLGVAELQAGLQLNWGDGRRFAYARLGVECHTVFVGGGESDATLFGWMLGFGVGF